MSSFIIPVGGLPTISSVGGTTNQPVAGQTGGTNIPFANVLESALQNIEGTSEVSQENLYNLAMGNSDDLHTNAIASLKSSTAMSFTASLTTSAIRAYNELLKMQI